MAKQNLFQKPILTKEPARQLTDREIAKIISGVLGSLAEWNDVDAIMRALKHIEVNKNEYREMLVQIKNHQF